MCATEDVLEVYPRDRAEDEVPVCMDETSRQQVGETRAPRPVAPGAPTVCDYEYERNGTSNLFTLFAPLEGWRRVEVTERRTKVDWAHPCPGPGGRGPSRQAGGAVDGQPQHAHAGVAVRGVRAGGGEAGAPAPRVRARGLAVHHRRREGQAEVPLSLNTNVMGY